MFTQGQEQSIGTDAISAMCGFGGGGLATLGVWCHAKCSTYSKGDEVTHEAHRSVFRGIWFPIAIVCAILALLVTQNSSYNVPPALKNSLILLIGVNVAAWVLWGIHTMNKLDVVRIFKLKEGGPRGSTCSNIMRNLKAIKREMEKQDKDSTNSGSTSSDSRGTAGTESVASTDKESPRRASPAPAEERTRLASPAPAEETPSEAATPAPAGKDGISTSTGTGIHARNSSGSSIRLPDQPSTPVERNGTHARTNSAHSTHSNRLPERRPSRGSPAHSSSSHALAERRGSCDPAGSSSCIPGLKHARAVARDRPSSNSSESESTKRDRELAGAQHVFASQRQTQEEILSDLSAGVANTDNMRTGCGWPTGEIKLPPTHPLLAYANQHGNWS